MLKYNYSQALMSKCIAKLNEIAVQNVSLESDINKMCMDYHIMVQSSTFKDTYIEFLEKEQTSFHQKIKKLGKNHPVQYFFQKDPI